MINTHTHTNQKKLKFMSVSIFTEVEDQTLDVWHYMAERIVMV